MMPLSCNEIYLNIKFRNYLYNYRSPQTCGTIVGSLSTQIRNNGAQSALWAEINRQLTKIRVWRILRAVRFKRFDQSTTSNNVTDWLIFLLMLAWTVTFADVGARNRQARVQNYGHCWAYNFRTFSCKYWFVTAMKNRTSCDNYNQNWILYSANI